MTTQQSHADIPDAGAADGGVPAGQRQFLGATAEVLGSTPMQRFMWADVRRRSHGTRSLDLAAQRGGLWRRRCAGGILGRRDLRRLMGMGRDRPVDSCGPRCPARRRAPLCRSRGRARHAGATLAATAAEFDRYIQRQLGPSTWRHDPADVDDLISVLDALEDALGQTDWARLPRTAPRRRDIAATAAHGEYLLSCLQIANLPLPPPATWV